MNDHLSVYSRQHLAQHFDGKIAFRFADYYTDEKLRMTYEIYQPGKPFTFMKKVIMVYTRMLFHLQELLIRLVKMSTKEKN